MQLTLLANPDFQGGFPHGEFYIWPKCGIQNIGHILNTETRKCTCYQKLHPNTPISPYTFPPAMSLN